MVSPRDLSLVQYCFCFIYIDDFHLCSSLFDFHLFTDDANLFYRHKNNILQSSINSELANIHNWLCANKVSLNIEKSNFVIFHPSQKKLTSNFELILNNKLLQPEKCIKYLGILIDSNLTVAGKIRLNILQKR